MTLNKQQEIAANHREGPCLCAAGPGSGKTRVITERVHRLIESGVSANSIVCITFTNKATNEMRERIEKRSGDAGKKVFVSTFHRLCSMILRYYGEAVGYGHKMTILDEDEQVSLVSQIARQKGYELTKPEVRKIVHQVNDWRENLEDDAALSDRYAKIRKDEWYGIAKEYLVVTKNKHLIDFSGLLSETVNLLTTNSNVLQHLQKFWKWAMVDETQDTNTAQWKIVDLLFAHTRNIFAVGDCDQTVYSWRGARIENVRDFCQRYNDAKIVQLGQNYRSTPQIISHAKKLIEHNENRISSGELWTENPDGVPVVCRAHGSDLQEADAIAKTISGLVRGGKYKCEDVAVLYRINSMSRALEMAMLANHVPHTVIGNFSFFDRREIKDCIAMLRFFVNQKDGLALHRFCNHPRRSLGDVAIGKIEVYSQANNVTLLDAMKAMTFSKATTIGVQEILSAFEFDHSGMTIAEILGHLLEKMKYKEYLDEDPETKDDRWENVQELLRDAARYSQENGPKLAQYLDQLSLVTSSDKEADENSVSLMSLHAAKGLEYPVIFIVGVEQGIIPHKKAVSEREDGMEEERRLFYVGITRAEEVLSVSWCQKRQDGYGSAGGKLNYRRTQPSQFLAEAELYKAAPISSGPRPPSIYDFT